MVPSLSFLVPKVAVWGVEMQTCSLNFLALTVGVLVETPIYFLSFLVPKVGDGDVHPSCGLHNTAASGIICTNMPSAEDNAETPEE
jgi:hypothetical protein